VTELQTATETYGDPLTAELWQAARRGELLVQRCDDCGHHQHYPRAFCLSCESPAVTWAVASGAATIYSQTTVHLKTHPFLQPPYVAAVVELAEGPRLTTNIVGELTRIGDAVTLEWQEREGGLPPYPVFRRALDG
jgi:uncharacterized OB-fold protein